MIPVRHGGLPAENTVTENGHVARGVCVENENHELLSVTERTRIEKGETCPRYTEDEGKTWSDLPGDTIVSMNLWGFTRSYLDEAWEALPRLPGRCHQEQPHQGRVLPAQRGEPAHCRRQGPC